MSKSLKKFTNNEKAKIALAAIKGEKTLAQISSEFQVHATQIGLWKKQVTENIPSLFENSKKKEYQKEVEHREIVDRLHRIIGQREAELEWLQRKVSSFSP